MRTLYINSRKEAGQEAGPEAVLLQLPEDPEKDSKVRAKVRVIQVGPSHSHFTFLVSIAS